MIGKKRNKCKVHTINCRKYISKKYFTMMFIYDPTKKAKTMQLPKWISLPIVLVVILLAIAPFISTSYIIQQDIKSTRVLANAMDIKKENKKYQEEIARLKKTNEKQLAQLKDVQEKTEELKTALSGISTTQKELVDKLGGEVKTTDQAAGEKLIIYEQKTDLALNDSSRYNDNPRQYLSSTDEFEEYLQSLEQDLDIMNSDVEKKEQNMEKITSKVDKTIKYWASVPSIKPVNGIVTSPFGYRRNPTGGGYEPHTGIDLAVPSGTPVKATADGVVCETGDQKGGYGYYVLIDHGYGIKTRYAHNSKILVTKGQKVKRGDIITKSGNTGRSTGPHLHYEVIVNGKVQNPAGFFN